MKTLMIFHDCFIFLAHTWQQRTGVNKCLLTRFHFKHKNHCRAHNKTCFLTCAPQSIANPQLHVSYKVLCFTFFFSAAFFFFFFACYLISIKLGLNISVLGRIPFLKPSSTLPLGLQQALVREEPLGL